MHLSTVDFDRAAESDRRMLRLLAGRPSSLGRPADEVLLVGRPVPFARLAGAISRASGARSTWTETWTEHTAVLVLPGADDWATQLCVQGPPTLTIAGSLTSRRFSSFAVARHKSSLAAGSCPRFAVVEGASHASFAPGIVAKDPAPSALICA